MTKRFVRALTAFEVFGADVPPNPDPRFADLTSRQLTERILAEDGFPSTAEWNAARRELARRQHFAGPTQRLREGSNRGGKQPPTGGVREPRKPPPASGTGAADAGEQASQAQ
jgi:hypothetical protein